jgi:hypothetical protein
MLLSALTAVLTVLAVDAAVWEREMAITGKYLAMRRRVRDRDDLQYEGEIF